MRVRRLLLVGLLLAPLTTAPRVRASVNQAPAAGALGDSTFWQLINDLSEAGGAFPQQLMSNEDSAQAVIPTLKKTVPTGGVYVGVGSEQNFTYIAAVHPRLAFIVDIRRENLLEMLMYKALFELSRDRPAFLARLFSRPLQADLDAKTNVTTLFKRFETALPSAALVEANTRDVIEMLVRGHNIPLAPADQSLIASMMERFRAAGPGALKGYGDLNPAFADLMTATDFAGAQQSFLATEEAYQTVRALHQQNLILPLVGDFAGDKALRGIGDYLRARQAAVQVFYVSNVERYLFEQGTHGLRFYANVEALPRDSGSVFIRSVTRDISVRLGITLPDTPTKWWTFTAPIAADLDGLAAGRIQTYADLFRH